MDKALAKELEIVREDSKLIWRMGNLAKTFEAGDDEDDRGMHLLHILNLLTAKPVIFAANVSRG